MCVLLEHFRVPALVGEDLCLGFEKAFVAVFVLCDGDAVGELEAGGPALGQRVVGDDRGVVAPADVGVRDHQPGGVLGLFELAVPVAMRGDAGMGLHRAVPHLLVHGDRAALLRLFTRRSAFIYAGERGANVSSGVHIKSVSHLPLVARGRLNPNIASVLSRLWWRLVRWNPGLSPPPPHLLLLSFLPPSVLPILLVLSFLLCVLSVLLRHSVEQFLSFLSLLLGRPRRRVPACCFKGFLFSLFVLHGLCALLLFLDFLLAQPFFECLLSRGSRHVPCICPSLGGRSLCLWCRWWLCLSLWFLPGAFLRRDGGGDLAWRSTAPK